MVPAGNIGRPSSVQMRIHRRAVLTPLDVAAESGIRYHAADPLVVDADLGRGPVIEFGRVPRGTLGIVIRVDDTDPLQELAI